MKGVELSLSGGWIEVAAIVHPPGEVVVRMRPVSVFAKGPGSETEQLRGDLHGRWRQATRAVMVLLSLHGLAAARIAELPGDPGWRTSADFFALLQMLAEAFPRTPVIAVICDNDGIRPAPADPPFFLQPVTGSGAGHRRALDRSRLPPGYEQNSRNAA